MSSFGRILARRALNRNNPDTPAEEAAPTSHEESHGPRRPDREFIRPDLRPGAPATQPKPHAPAQQAIAHAPHANPVHAPKKNAPEALIKPNDVTIVPDSWENKRGIPLGAKPEQKDDTGGEAIPKEALRRRRQEARRLPKNKVRRFVISIAVSEDEATAFHAHAGKKGLTTSEWARAVLTRSMTRTDQN